MIRGEFRAVQVSPPGPPFPSYDAWRAFLSRAALALGALLLAAGLACLVAANWPGMPRWQRFALAQAVLAGLALLAFWREGRGGAAAGTGGPAGRRIRAALLGVAGVALGALLALLGQAYPTGADAWELFAWWAVLLAPWALAAGSAAVWLLWVAVANAAAGFWLHATAQLRWLPGVDLPLAGIAQAAFAAVLLAAWEWAAARAGHRGRSGPRLLAALALACLVPAVVLGDLGRQAWPALAAWAAATAGLLLAYRRRPTDRVILALAAAGVMAVSLRLAGEWLFAVLDDEFALLPLAVLLVAESAWAARWLRRVPPPAECVPPARLQDAGETGGRAAGTRQAEPEAGGLPGGDGPGGGCAAGDAGAPWYVQALLALGAWLATLILLAFLLAADLVGSPAGALALGVVLAAAAVAALRAARGDFLRQLGTAAGLAGLALAGYGLGELLPGGATAWVAWLLAAALLAVAAPSPALRLLCGLAVALAWVGAVHGAGGGEAWDALEALAGGEQPGRMLWALAVLAGAAAALWAVGSRRADAGGLPPGASRPAGASRLAGPLLPPSLLPLSLFRPWAWAWTAAVQGLAWLAPGTALPRWPALFAHDPAAALGLAALAALPAAVAAWALHPARGRHQPAALRLGLPAALLVLALSWLPAPGVALGLAWLLLGHALARRGLAAFGAAGLLAYLLHYYYQQQVPLWEKGLWLGAAGLALLALGGLARRLRSGAGSSVGGSAAANPAAFVPDQGEPTAARRAMGSLPRSVVRYRRAWIAGGLLLALGFANFAIAGRERLLARGRRVVLELAPVDPRALLLGDYMALDFALARELSRELARDEGAPRRGWLVVRPDAEGVARAVRIQAGPVPLEAGEAALRYRRRGRAVRLAPDAYFFPEGQAAHYARARYGELRVDAQGNALLAGLLDEARRPL